MDELETAIVAAEEAVAALDAAIETAGDKASDELIERANKLRGKREELTDEEKKKLEDEAAEAARGQRADDDEAELTDEEKKKDDEEIRGLRSTAVSYGLTKLVDDLKGLGARSKKIRTALKNAVAARGSAPASTPADLKHKPQTPAVPELNARSIYDKINGRTK